MAQVRWKFQTQLPVVIHSVKTYLAPRLARDGDKAHEANPHTRWGRISAGQARTVSSVARSDSSTFCDGHRRIMPQMGPTSPSSGHLVRVASHCCATCENAEIWTGVSGARTTSALALFGQVALSQARPRLLQGEVGARAVLGSPSRHASSSNSHARFTGMFRIRPFPRSVDSIEAILLRSRRKGFGTRPKRDP